MPQAAWSEKRERQYEHVKEACLERGRGEQECTRMAAATVNATRSRKGELLHPKCPHAKRFHELVNMSPREIRAWASDPRRKLASEPSTRARLPALATLKAKPVGKWTPADCRFAARVVSFNSRMDGMRKTHGCTPKIGVSLRNWGRHAPGCALPRKS